jgi:gamma-glutamylcyclotransferase
MSTSNPNPDQTPRLYFAYGSNLSLAQMSSRCPTSTYHSLGILHHYTWVIGPRGYANVLYTPPSSSSTSYSLSSHSRKEGQPDVVYGLLYTLEPEDEALLDRAEGVPKSYTKHDLDVEILTGEKKGMVKALVYVDEIRKGTGTCKEEYVARMNRGIKDALEKGMPRWYVEDVLRKWVREEEVGDGKIGDPFHPKVWVGEGIEVLE